MNCIIQNNYRVLFLVRNNSAQLNRTRHPLIRKETKNERSDCKNRKSPI
jgi:hypothetical protein